AAVVSSTRPAAPIVALTPAPEVARRLALYWGVVPRAIDADDFARPQVVARQQVRDLGLASDGQVILLLAGFGKDEPAVTVAAGRWVGGGGGLIGGVGGGRVRGAGGRRGAARQPAKWVGGLGLVPLCPPGTHERASGAASARARQLANSPPIPGTHAGGRLWR